MNKSLLDAELDKLRRSADTVLSACISVITTLENSGILSFLERKAQCFFDPTRDANFNAMQAARASGYAEAIDDLIHFKELYFDAEAPRNSIINTGLQAAFDKGHMLKEELDAITRGKRPDQSSFVQSLDIEKRK